MKYVTCFSIGLFVGMSLQLQADARFVAFLVMMPLIVPSVLYHLLVWFGAKAYPQT
jgi:hypothetical protein